MNHWQQFLQQAHPDFKVETYPSVEEETIMDTHPSSEIETQNETVELEWISPLAKLHDKIENIPDKMGFKIGEVADFVGVKQYVLRYWESEFDVLHPKKAPNGQRMYNRRDVETALLIKKLLHEDRFSIEGAKSALKKLKKQIKDKVENAIETQVETTQTTSSSTMVVASSEALQSAELLLETIRMARIELNLE